MGEHTAGSLLCAGDLVTDAALEVDDHDAFDHRAIAHRIAELVCVATPPVNVALFGAWGSGKSSVFSTVKDTVESRSRTTRVIRYDAWKYGGKALKRNFIASAAHSLSINPNDLRIDLHNQKEFNDFNLLRWLWRSRGNLVVGIAAAAIFALVWGLLMTVVTVYAADISRREALISNLVPAGTVFSLALIALLVGPKALESANVKISTPAPVDDDEFATAFQELVQKATGGKGRLVVFIDELDRCLPEDVVSTLIDLKTFLDQSRCVFIVAADREVLVHALQKVPQAKPLREDEPYYATPGAFLDKIFQHQLALPPLRPQALGRFARELVHDHDGIWAELRSAGNGDREFDLVIYSLIPAHVRSPRRVKVLLNAFATNMRVAQARNIDHLARAAEIAKLTALQTEFPAVAADLLTVPRLCSWLLNPPSDLPDGVSTVLKRYEVAEIAAVPLPGNGDAQSPAGPLLGTALEAGDNDTRAARRAENRLNLELWAYLRKTAAVGVHDPRPELLYLKGAGSEQGITDPQLGHIIDFAGETPPQDTVAAFASQPPGTLRIAAVLMAQHSDAEFGPSKAFLVESVCRLATKLGGEELAPIAAQLAPSVAVMAGDPDWTPRMLPGSVLIAATADDAGMLDKLTDLLGQADPEHLGQIVPALAHLRNGGHRDRLLSYIARTYPVDPQPLLDGLADLPTAHATALWRAANPVVIEHWHELDIPPEPPRAAVTSAATPTETPTPNTETVDELVAEVASLLEAVCARSEPAAQLMSDVLLAVQQLACDDPRLHTTIRRSADHILPLLTDPQARQQHALRGLHRGFVDDIDFWASFLPTPPAQADLVARDAVASLLSVIVSEPADVTADIAAVIGSVAACAPETTVADIIADAETELKPLDWAGSDTLARRKHYYAALDELANRDESARDIQAHDLSSAVTANAYSTSVVDQVMQLVPALEPSVADQIRDNLRQPDPLQPTAIGHTRVYLALTHHTGHPPLPAELIAAITTTGPDHQRLTEEWLATSPAHTEVITAISALTSYFPSQALRDYSSSLTLERRTELWIQARGNGVPADVSKAIGQAGIGADAVRFVSRRIEDETRQAERNRILDYILAVPLDPSAVAAANELTLQLLGRDCKGDARLAAQLITRVGPAHGYKEKLRSQFRAYDQAETFNTALRNALVDQTLLAPKSEVAKRGTLQRLLDNLSR
ncbi:P-loop NTPase fold protein [Nocardia sp. NPDC019219]|uniref:P-loop NTPase fold protein n=1 Tax=Nocardia TaxID=1817 RepID=UPI0024901EF1|nr:P-loop NTPase fold protein [Nocardia sputorum]